MLFKQKTFLLGQVGRKMLSLPPQSGACAHKTVFHFQVISNCSSSQAHSRTPRSAGHTLLCFLLGPETPGKGSCRWVFSRAPSASLSPTQRCLPVRPSTRGGSDLGPAPTLTGSCISPRLQPTGSSPGNERFGILRSLESCAKRVRLLF